jgi:copper chaperone NosL
VSLRTRLQPLVDRFEVFLDEPIRFRARPVLALLVIPLLLSFTQPLWRISMEAPQYPQGLHIDVYAYTLGAGHGGHDIDEINELNHYIGMRRLSRQEFTDLDWIPFALGLLGILTLRAAVIGKVSTLIDLTILTGYITVFALARFVYRLYVFGHDLDPHAAIRVSPFMPVVLGTKQVANFTTHSWPLWGTVFMAVFAGGIIAVTVWHCWAGYIEAWHRDTAAVPPRAE